MYFVAAGLGDQSRCIGSCDVLEFSYGRALVDHAQDVSQAHSVWLDRTEISFSRRIIRRPKLASTSRRTLQLTHEVSIDPSDHFRCQITLAIERLRSRQRICERSGSLNE